MRRRSRRATTLHCETCDQPKRFEQVRLRQLAVHEREAAEAGAARSPLTLTSEVVTNEYARRGVWERALRGEFPDTDDRSRNYSLECDRSHPIATVETLRICAIGLTQTGKTHFLIALFHLLLDDAIPHVAMTPLGDAEMQRIRPVVRDVFDLHQVRPGTMWDRTEEVLPFSFALEVDRADGSTQTVPVDIFDFPGELAEGGELTTAFAPFVATADALLFFINPLSIKGLTETMLESTAQAGDAPGVMFNRYANLWRLRHDLPIFGEALTPADTPIGVVLNRADVLEDHPDPEVRHQVTAALKEEPPGSLTDLSGYIDQHSHLARSLLTYGSKQNKQGLVKRIEKNYPLVRYFVASPLGGQPHGDIGKNDAWQESEYTLGGIALPFLAVVYGLLDGQGAGR